MSSQWYANAKKKNKKKISFNDVWGIFQSGTVSTPSSLLQSLGLAQFFVGMDAPQLFHWSARDSQEVLAWKYSLVPIPVYFPRRNYSAAISVCLFHLRRHRRKVNRDLTLFLCSFQFALLKVLLGPIICDIWYFWHNADTSCEWRH